jgi:hypothetical protein
MAYTTATFNVLIPGIGGAPTLWSYTNTDAHGTVSGAGYFTDGASKGLKANDIVIVVDTDSNQCTIHKATGVDTIAAATLS